MAAAAVLSSVLPAPKYDTSLPVEETASRPLPPKKKSLIPKYGQRKGWKPQEQADFGDGGSYPECHIAQYPLMLGKKTVSSGNTLALQVDSEGNVRYDALAKRGHRDGVNVQSAFKDLVPLALRTDVQNAEMERPSEEDVQDTTDRTRAALEKLVSGKIKAAQPKNVPSSAQGRDNYVRYTSGTVHADGHSQKIIKMVDVAEDPLEPPKFKHRKVPRGPGSPPPPVLRSPPRRATAQDQKDWMIPPCVSNWKNNKGYTIPLDKRLAADGRGLQDIHINDKFATFSESLYIADRHAREEVRQRSAMQQRIAEKEKEQKEETLRLLAARARDERVNATPAISAGDRLGAIAGGTTAMPSLAGYGSDSDEEASEAEEDEPSGTGAGEDDAAARERDRMRAERRKERERELRMNNMGTERRARVMARAQNRDISEKVALGLAKPTLSKESMLDSRLFNQEQYSASFGDDDSYNLYDKPLFQGSSAAQAIYKPMANNEEEESFGGGTEDGIKRTLANDRFELGVAGKGFEGAAEQERRSGPVQFERDSAVADPFGVSAFLDEAKRNAQKRGLDAEAEGSSKRRRE